MPQPADTDAVAIVGMAGRFPGARDVSEFWGNLLAGVDAIRRDRDADAAAHQDGARAWIVHAGGVLDDVEYFDADFFAVPPAEAAWMDPQHRLFLECAWHALEDAGRPPLELQCPVSVYAGANFNAYLPARLDQLIGKDTVQFMQIFMANEKDFLTSRVSYKLNLRGESIAVQTSCSTSLVAVHLGCQSLLSGQSDLALAGGVSVRIPQRASYAYEAGLIASPDGHCRPFDHRAAGTVPGNGVGVVVLKRLDEAIADRDHCYAVIKGSWINNDGKGKVGFTAPSVDGQAAVISRSHAMAGVDADSIGYIETHGTGTAMGDPIEIEALTRVFRKQTDRRGFCALGAIKASIGHLDTAAGVAGLIKASLALHHRCIPPASYFERPHPAIDLERSPFYVNTSPVLWAGGPIPRRAGVSGFGVGGTNAHLVLEEAPARTRRASARPVQIVTMSAKTAASRDAAVAALTAHVARQPEVELRDVAYTRNVGRSHFPHRRFAVAATANALGQAFAATGDFSACAPSPGGAVVFMFAGQGAQTIGMAGGLYAGDPVFREEFDRCLRYADARLGCRLRDVIFDTGGDGAAAKLARPSFTLPALFSVEYALAQLWRSWGIAPAAVIGHSYGELVAACINGVFSLEDAVTVAVERGRLMERMPPGLMLAVPLSDDEVAPLLGDDVFLASINGDKRTVVSGSEAAITRVEESLRARGTAACRLDVPLAYHSALLDPLLEEYAALIARTARMPPRVPAVSSRSGDWLSETDAGDPLYWTRQMREPVRFADGLRRLRAAGHTCFVEIGPGQTLTQLARGVLDRDALVVPSLGAGTAPDADWHTLLTAVGRLWLRGAPIDWRALEHAQGGWLVPLPGYVFDRQRHWVELSPSRTGASAVAASGETDTAGPATAASPNATVLRAPERLDAPGRDPRQTIERRLIAIWCEVFGRTSVGIHDDFLELGGDSLAAIRIQSRLQQALGIPLPIEQILTMTTVAELAAALVPQIPAPAAGAGDPAGQATVVAVVASGDAPDEVPQPLSFAQEWLWTLHSLAPKSPAYHLPVAVRLRGTFVPEAFAWAVDQVARRHDALRTVFGQVDQRPVALVRAVTPPPFAVVDVSGRDPASRQALAQKVVQALTLPHFDLAAAPPWRACVVHLDADDHVAAFVLHHIISDAWSMGLLVGEVAASYHARCENRRPSLPDLPTQYPTFARRQRASVDKDGVELVGYWKRQLANVPPLLNLSHRSRPPVQSHSGGRQGFGVDAVLGRRLVDLARRERATLFMVLLAAYESLLYRLTDRDDFCVGVPTAGRLEPDVEPLIGCFMNTLPIRARLAGHPTFLELLQRVRRTVLDAFARQAMPFGRIVQELRPARSSSYTPIFQVVFDFNSTPRSSAPADPTLQYEWFGAPMATAKTDLIVDVTPGSGGALHGSVEYDRALFDEVEIAAMMNSFVVVLGAIADNPAQRILTLPLESDDAAARRLSGARQRDDASRERLLAVGAGRRPSRGGSRQV